MLPTKQLYALILRFLQALGAIPHATAREALADLLTAVLLAQSLRPTPLMRAQLSPLHAVPARQAYKRVARAWNRPWLTPVVLTPQLVPGALRLVGPGTRTPHVALDSVIAGTWQILTLGLVVQTRVVPLAWHVLAARPAAGQFTPAVVGLVRAVAAAWPADVPRPHLVADRAFPSRALFQTLADAGWGWTVRLRASDWIVLDDGGQRIRPLLETATDGSWTARSAHWGGDGPPLPGTLVIGRGLLVLPYHQRGPASLAARRRQWQRRQWHVRGKHGKKRRPDASEQTDAWVVLFTSHPTWQAADASYRRRWPLESSYRDAQSGHDGHSGWDLETVVRRAPTAQRVTALTGLWALGSLIQLWVGQEVRAAEPASLPGGVVRGWSTTGRLSVWMVGRLALTDPTGQLQDWLWKTLQRGIERLATHTDHTLFAEAA